MTMIEMHVIMEKNGQWEIFPELGDVEQGYQKVIWGSL